MGLIILLILIPYHDIDNKTAADDLIIIFDNDDGNDDGNDIDSNGFKDDDCDDGIDDDGNDGNDGNDDNDEVEGDDDIDLISLSLLLYITI